MASLPRQRGTPRRPGWTAVASQQGLSGTQNRLGMSIAPSPFAYLLLGTSSSYASVREKGSYCKIYVEFIEVLLIGQNM